MRQNNRDLVRALHNVSFSLNSGDRLALLGHNGSGKTTLLRVLAGILQPQAGKVECMGTLGNALDTRIGFRNEATGRRNIVLKALIGGIHGAEIGNFVDKVCEFAELGPFIDAPLRTYSAGMRARLAFGIATTFRHDVLLLDEWLGAGDQALREKVQQRMQKLVSDSSILVLASHSHQIIKDTCNLGLLMKQGEIAFFGKVEDALDLYRGNEKPTK